MTFDVSMNGPLPSHMRVGGLCRPMREPSFAPGVPFVSFCRVLAFRIVLQHCWQASCSPPPGIQRRSSASPLFATPGWAHILCACCKPALLCHQDYRLRRGRLMTDNLAPRSAAPQHMQRRDQCVRYRGESLVITGKIMYPVGLETTC